MSLSHLIELMADNFPDQQQTELYKFIMGYAEADRLEKQKLAANRALWFGRYKGMTVKQLSETDAGKDYLSWMLSQSWCEGDKYSAIIKDCQELNIRKKKAPKSLNQSP